MQNKLLIVGVVNTQMEVLEINYIMKVFLVGDRARYLGKISRRRKK